MYNRFKHATIRWTHKWLFELALAQIKVGFLLMVLAYALKTGEPVIILWMSGLALVFSGLTTAAVAAIDDDGDN